MESAESESSDVGSGYASYATGVLLLVYVFNFIDRQIISILAEEIKADLGISDAQIGFLYGTAFAVFYAIFGLPLGKLADSWTRKNLISIGMCKLNMRNVIRATMGKCIKYIQYAPSEINLDLAL